MRGVFRAGSRQTAPLYSKKRDDLGANNATRDYQRSSPRQGEESGENDMVEEGWGRVSRCNDHTPRDAAYSRHKVAMQHLVIHETRRGATETACRSPSSHSHFGSSCMWAPGSRISHFSRRSDSAASKSCIKLRARRERGFAARLEGRSDWPNDASEVSHLLSRHFTAAAAFGWLKPKYPVQTGVDRGTRALNERAVAGFGERATNKATQQAGGEPVPRRQGTAMKRVRTCSSGRRSRGVAGSPVVGRGRALDGLFPGTLSSAGAARASGTARRRVLAPVRRSLQREIRGGAGQVGKRATEDPRASRDGLDFS